MVTRMVTTVTNLNLNPSNKKGALINVSASFLFVRWSESDDAALFQGFDHAKTIGFAKRTN